MSEADQKFSGGLRFMHPAKRARARRAHDRPRPNPGLAGTSSIRSASLPKSQCPRNEPRLARGTRNRIANPPSGGRAASHARAPLLGAGRHGMQVR